MKSHLPRFAAALLLLASLSPAARAAEKLALVIGIGKYEHVSVLANPVNDAMDVAERLTQGGFKVTQLSDVSRAEFLAALRGLESQATGAPFLVVYFAGHGVEVQGNNYLVPTDGQLSDAARVESELVSLTEVLSAVKRTQVPLSLIVLDSCRDNPFGKEGGGTGLAAVSTQEMPEGALVVYSGEPGMQVPDGTGSNSPFAERLLAEPSRAWGWSTCSRAFPAASGASGPG